MNAYAGIEEAKRIVSLLPCKPIKGDYRFEPDLKDPGFKHIWASTAATLAEHARSCGPNARELTLRWASDCWVALAEFERALDVLPMPDLGSRMSLLTSSRLSIKLEIERDIEAREILTLFGPKLTKFGRENLEAIEQFVAISVNALGKEELSNLLKEWATDAPKEGDEYSLFNGHPSYVISRRLKLVNFDRSLRAESLCSNLIRQAENAFREDQGLPKIGEGWIAETALYYEIKNHFSTLEVLQHFSPEFLGRQHFDVYLPSLKIALEYQGLQHDRPVEFFGGLEAFEKTKQRDRRKKNLCDKYGVRLIYVREGYNLCEVILKINEYLTNGENYNHQ